MFSTLCLTLSSGILFYVLKYRVHIHVTYTPKRSKSQNSIGRRKQGDKTLFVPIPDIGRGTVSRLDQPAARLGQRGPDHDESDDRIRRGSEIQSALRNLGAKPATARAAAAKAIAQTNDFDQALKLAIQYATTKEAA